VNLPRPARAWLWLLLALPGLLQLLLLCTAFFARFAYPYDLEWMEGGMLTHAAQLDEGRTMYRAPSVDFIPYLYTPLYPTVLAALGKLFGLGYQVGRAVSIVSTFIVLLLWCAATCCSWPSPWAACWRCAPGRRRASPRGAASATVAWRWPRRCSRSPSSPSRPACCWSPPAAWRWCA
jgi:hypothetical protein